MVVYIGRTQVLKSRIRETPNLLTNADRRTDTEKNIQRFFSSSGDLVKRGWADVPSTAEHTTLHHTIVNIHPTPV